MSYQAIARRADGQRFRLTGRRERRSAPFEDRSLAEDWARFIESWYGKRGVEVLTEVVEVPE